MAFPRPFGRYLLDERLAMGGMAEIYRGRTSTEGFEKKVCIKRILPHFTEQEDFVLMFRDEAALAARLQHANIVQVFDFGTEEDTLFLAMELVEGADLRRVLDLAKKQGVSLGTGHAMQIAIEVCRGLHHAHTLTDDAGQPLGIVHRDISPHNILVSRAGEVKVTDFGIAKASARATHTGTGVVKGKLAYMAPEQANSKPFDQRVDQFATGIVLWEMLTGQRLFAGADEVTILRKVMTCEVPRPSTLRSDLPPALEDIVMRALAEDPDERFADMRHLEHALGRCLFEVTSDPEETNLRPLLERVLGPPEASRRNTKVLVENPVLSAPGESIPSLTEAGFSAVFAPSQERKAQDSIASVLGDDSAPSGAATVMLEGSSSNPVARVPEHGTGVTRTVVPGGAPTGPTAPPSPAPQTSASFPPSSSPVAPERAEPRETTTTGELERPSTVEVPRYAARSNRAFVAAGGVVLVAVAVLAFLVTRGASEPADDVTVTLATPSPTEAGELAPSAAASGADGTGSAPASPDDEPAAAEVAAVEEAAPETPEPADGRATAALKVAPETAPPEAAPSEAAQPKAAPPAKKPQKLDENRGSQRPERSRGKGKLILEMASGWAHAYLGKTKVCETPCTVVLPAGSHLLRLKAGDGTERRHRVHVKADATVRSVVPPG